MTELRDEIEKVFRGIRAKPSFFNYGVDAMTKIIERECAWSFTDGAFKVGEKIKKDIEEVFQRHGLEQSK